MRQAFIIGIFFVIGATGTSRSIAVPPPPPPPGAMERATKIASPPGAADLPSYLTLFSDDVTVLEGDMLVASGQAALSAYLKPRLALHHRILHISYGNPIMVVETINNMSYRGPNVVQDCCFWARVSFYHLRDDGKVDTVRIAENGTFWGPPERPE